MSETRRTPAPWHRDGTTIRAGNQVVAHAIKPQDATLLAAAPGLLRQLKIVANCLEFVLDGKMGVNDLTRGAVKDAIAQIDRAQRAVEVL